MQYYFFTDVSQKIEQNYSWGCYKYKNIQKLFMEYYWIIVIVIVCVVFLYYICAESNRKIKSDTNTLREKIVKPDENSDCCEDIPYHGHNHSVSSCGSGCSGDS